MIEKVGENLYRSHLRPFKQTPVSARLCGAGHRLSVLEGNLGRTAARRGGAGHRAHLRRQPLQPENRAAQRRRPGPREGRSRHRVPDRRARRRRSSRRSTAKPSIPLIAIEVPHPGATYFGANNYEAGLIGGRHLGRWAKQHWHGEVDEIVLIALERAGSLPKMRLTGMLVGMKEICPPLENCQRHLPRRRRQARGELRSDAPAPAGEQGRGGCSSARSTIPSALGALRAFQEAGRSETCAIMGQNAVARRTRRAAPARHAADRLGRLLSREVRRRDRRRRARHPPPPLGAARRCSSSTSS